MWMGIGGASGPPLLPHHDPGPQDPFWSPPQVSRPEALSERIALFQVVLLEEAP